MLLWSGVPFPSLAITATDETPHRAWKVLGVPILHINTHPRSGAQKSCPYPTPLLEMCNIVVGLSFSCVFRQFDNRWAQLPGVFNLQMSA